MCIHNIADFPPSAWTAVQQAHVRMTVRQLKKTSLRTTRQLGKARTFFLTILEIKIYIGRFIYCVIDQTLFFQNLVLKSLF